MQLGLRGDAEARQPPPDAFEESRLTLVCQIKHELAVLPILVAESVLPLKHRRFQGLATVALEDILNHL